MIKKPLSTPSSSKVTYRALRNLFFIMVLSLLFIQPAVSDNGSVKVDGIRHFSGETYTRVVVDLNKKTTFDYRLLKEDPSIKKPGRFYVDIKNAKLGEDLARAMEINDGLLSGVRSGQYKSDTVRVVLDIKSIADYKIFMLPNPHRIVIDIYGKGSKYVKSKAAVASKPGKTTAKSTKATKKNAVKVRTIVIDAGHGGRDPGAVGKRKLKEKDVTLKLAKLLKKDLSKSTKAKVILTRTKDVYVPLDERTAIANSKDADIFVSIHINASKRRAANGVETYYLGASGDEAARRVAERENASTSEEMNDILQYILKDLQQTGNKNESVRLASVIQERLAGDLKKKYKHVKSNGIKGALFYVLVNCNMPSVLVEVSFISNPDEEKRLRKDSYLKDVSKSISEAIVDYINGAGAV
ncbi:MAG: N-acetylmuramoyl-L-alanine amidase [Deltaproteobacteria bacterium]|nr:N-acetylmuramoyl-L-alanine amidase [Deltaproteobacteria bacterium]